MIRVKEEDERPTSPTASEAPYVAKACWTRPWRHRLVLTASFPPLRTRPLPVAMESPAICGSTSGRDSKMTNSTPIGTVICFKFRPSVMRVRLRVRLRQSFVDSATWRRPSDKLFSLSGVMKSRDIKGFDNPVCHTKNSYKTFSTQEETHLKLQHKPCQDYW